MSDLKITRDSVSPAPKHGPEGMPKKGSEGSIDSISSYIADSEGLSIRRKSTAPELVIPEVYHDSMLDYFSALSGATLALKQQLAASDNVDFKNRRERILSSVSQTQLMQVLIEERAEKLRNLEKDAKEALKELEKKIKLIQKDEKQLNNWIQEINSGNGVEKEQYAELAAAYDDFVNQLKGIGAVDKGNGKFEIPEKSHAQFKAIKATYQQAVDKFNTYWKERVAELKGYNRAAIAYNQRVAENNRELSQLMSNYRLEEYFKSHGMAIPRQSKVGIRDLSKDPGTVRGPKLSENLATVVLSDAIWSVGQSGPSSVAIGLPMASIDPKLVFEGIRQSLYDLKIAPFDQEIAKIILFWQFTHSMQEALEKMTDPVLNIKPIAQRILPEGTLTSNRTVSESQIALSPLQSLGVDSDQLEMVLGKKLMKQVMEAFEMRTDQKVSEKKTEELSDKFLLLSVGLLGNQSLEALFPSLSPITKALSTIPPDSPIFALLFSLSLGNRILEDCNLGLNQEAIKTFIKEIPELQGLEEADVEKLEAALNLGQLMVGLKMIETSLGLPQLSSHLLAPMASIDEKELLTENRKEREVFLTHLQEKSESHLIAEGFSPEEAQFLSQFGINLSKGGILTPSAPFISAPESIDKPLLIDSLKAAFILSRSPLKPEHRKDQKIVPIESALKPIPKIPLKEVEEIVREAVEQVLSETPLSSAKHLRTKLAQQLHNQGLGDRGADIARQAVVVPLTREIQPNEDLKVFVENRAIELLSPQMGRPSAKKVTEELTKSLFEGKYSFKEAIKNQISTLRKEKDQKLFEKVAEMFKESIKSMESFYAFSLKLIDPAYFLVYSGIIYGDHGRKKGIDLQI